MFDSPNHTQVPNQFFDVMLKDLDLAETKILLVVFRKTFGWQKQRDWISLSQLQELSGLTKRSVLKSVRTLEKKKFIKKTVEGQKGEQKTFYELVIREEKGEGGSIPSTPPPQCTKYTPPSILGIPTKETLTKETSSKEEKLEKEESFRLEEVEMPVSRYRALVEQFSQAEADWAIEEMRLYAKVHPDKFKKYRDHYAVATQWIRRERKRKEETQWKQNQPFIQKKSWNNQNRNSGTNGSKTSVGICNVDSSANVPLALLYPELDSIVPTGWTSQKRS